jgi:hypothetical protein
MKLLSILKVLLKEQTDKGAYPFLLKRTEIVDGLISEFVKSPLIKKLLDRKAVDPTNLNNGLISVLLGDPVDDAITELKLEMISKTEMDELKKELSLFSKSHSSDVVNSGPVYFAIAKGLEGDDSDLSKLSAKEIDSYLKYYTSDVMNSKYGMKNDPDYQELLNVLKSLKSK